MSDALGVIAVLAVLIGPLVYVTVRDRKRNQQSGEQLVSRLSPEETLDTVIEYLMRISCGRDFR